MQEIYHRPPPSWVSQAGTFVGYLLAVVGGTLLLAIASYATVPTAMWAAIPLAVGLFAVYRLKTVRTILGDASSSRPGVLEQPATRVLIISLIAGVGGIALTVTGTPAIGFPIVLLTFPIAFVAFGIKLKWAARRAESHAVLGWDLFGRGALLVFGVWMVLEMVLVIAGPSSLGIPTEIGNIVAVAGIGLPTIFLLLERDRIRSRLRSVNLGPVVYIVHSVPALQYWTPPRPPDGESWRRISKPDYAPSMDEDPSNRRYSIKR
jgi:hypothetical protein